MRLKKIKLAGFKSFVDPTTIPFPSEMTAVVGPNGCGKSNVIDAVRWVLGESSAKNLRGDAMTDVIFNGSSARKPVGQCSVELFFDNSAGRIGGEYATYSELSVRRLVTRDAQSTYFLNGTKCRRRDVTDLFLGTGLGPRSYAIIEQGMISRLIESKPQELRVFIEEAAGISKYKERRRETENRIRHTQDNLERLNDVRDELGQQLEKLQRQAAAANRYKALREKVRELKGQLAGIRFLKNNEQTENLQHALQGHQQALDALVSRQHGDEAGMLIYKEQLAQNKQAADDVQQQLFTTSNAITRIEQNELHSQQRKQQIEAELATLTEQTNLLVTGLDEANQALATSKAGLDALLPQQELNDEALAQAKDMFENAEQERRDFSAQSREHEQIYHRLKQEVQTCHSQIQSTMNMQLRTTQRMSELNDELSQLDTDDVSERIAILTAQIDEAEVQVSEAFEQYNDTKEALVSSQQSLAQAESMHRQLDGERQSLQSTIAALSALQDDAATSNADVHSDLQLLWQHLTVPEHLNDCVETVLRYWQQPYIAGSLEVNELVNQITFLPMGGRVFAQSAFTDVKQPNTLAAALPNERVPEAFNHILLCETNADALRSVDTLAEGKTVLSQEGLWCAKDWVVRGGEVENSVLHRASKLAELSKNLNRIESDITLAQAKVEKANTLVIRNTELSDNAKLTHENLKNTLVQHTNAMSVLVMQNEQLAARNAKLKDELSKQNVMLGKEEAQLVTLSGQLEIHEAQLAEYEERVREAQNNREQFDNKVAQLRSKVESLTHQAHEMALKVQQLESHQNLYTQQVTRNQQQLTDYQFRRDTLSKELNDLSAPQAVQKVQLQELLTQKNELENKRSEYQSKQDDIEQLLRESEKGQQALAKDIQERTSNIEKLNIEIEGFKVRASAILEQLEDSKQSLKSILETLPDEADETKWQSELESTQGSLSRLGAVNLAAVEEYEIQSERKLHLDTQYNDLTDALETLQSAIRKIDKETRTRFSTTFEQVNQDLKALFPKVFGGGSAYLALTDDDLLETGVTIMARPPGKKNSTIHLLSGGEKALTALSLVFAIFRLNPAPFCLLDEVDAPLDDANVGRFCNLVSEMSQTVQFIYITHNKIAMEMATHLTGVTMAEPGVSRMVAVDVDEAMAFAEA
ncbi:chromosome partitioning protein ParA [Alteromonas stellipolaris]|uniref:chromosome segregation protein SMC n=1 Tax=Alteromonas stellipolaris TaxID=233316 RepID=UPI00076FFA0C|nr:chromosome segregation protein SMC [Alteromonas stellipolaris]AMJ94750.1 chromosome partitioning protein ParA [Alteromonas stellipolaris]